MTPHARLIALALIAASLPAIAQQSVERKWATSISGAAATSFDEFAAISADGYGSLYLAASTQFKAGSYYGDVMEARIVKVDRSGNPVWETFFRGDGPLGAVAADARYDPRGALLVAAQDYVDYNVYRSALLKYDTDGVLLWTAGRNDFFPSRLAVAQDGSVYLLGTQAAGSACTVIKYGLDGTEAWSWSLPGAKVQDGQPGAIAVTDDGGVVASCGTRVGSDPTSIELARLDAAGSQVWSGHHASGSTTTLKLDEAGNVIVGGSYGSNFVVAKWSADGTKLWGISHGNTSKFDELHALAIDQQGDIVATGIMDGAVGYLYSFTGTVKFSGTDGAVIWQNSYGTGIFNSGETVSIDGSGSVLVLAESQSGQTLIKYDAFGGQSWVDVAPQGLAQVTGGPSQSAATILAPLGCFVIAGTGANANGGSGSDVHLIRYCLGPELCS